MSWPWTPPPNQPQLFNPPPPLPPPPMPHQGFPPPPQFSHQASIPFSSFAPPQPMYNPHIHPHIHPHPSSNFSAPHYPVQSWHHTHPPSLYKFQQSQYGQGSVIMQQQTRGPLQHSARQRGGKRPSDPRRRPDGIKKETKGNGMDGSARDLALSQAVLKKLGVQLPAGGKDVEKWVNERKKNWPSKANVEKKLKESEKREQKKSEREEKGRGEVDAVAKLAEEYASSEEEGEIEEGGENEKGGRGGRGGGRGRGGRGRGRGGIQKGRKGRRGKGRKGGGNREVEKEARPSLLRMLLEKEIQRETSVLLQAFRYIADQNRDGEMGVAGRGKD